MFTAFAVRPPLALVNRSLGQARPVVLREQLRGLVQILQGLVNEAASGSLLCPGCVQRHLTSKLQLQPGQLPLAPANRRQQPDATAARLGKVAGYQLDRNPYRCRPQQLVQELAHGGEPRRIAGRPLQYAGRLPERRDRVRCTPKPRHLHAEPGLGVGTGSVDGWEGTHAPPSLGGKREIQRNSQPFSPGRGDGAQAS